MVDKKGYDYKKFFQGLLITFALFTAASVIVFFIMIKDIDFSTFDWSYNVSSLLGTCLIWWTIPSIFGGLYYVKKGAKAIFWAVGVTFSVIILAFATCFGLQGIFS